MALGFHQQTEVERIQRKLAEFLPAQEARAIASQVYDLALDEIHKHSWVAKRRRMNWEESRTLGLLTKEAIQEIIDIHEHRRQAEENPPPLSFEEQAFFKYFECEMSRPYSPR